MNEKNFVAHSLFLDYTIAYRWFRGDDMDKECEIIIDDLRKARRELGTYIDVTEEDLVQIYTLALKYAQERRSKEIPVAEVMTKDVVSVHPDMDIRDVARLLSDRGIGGLPVVDDKSEVVGVVTEALPSFSW